MEIAGKQRPKGSLRKEQKASGALAPLNITIRLFCRE